MPWSDPAVARGLHDSWVRDPRNVADAARLAGFARMLGETVLDYGCGTGRLAEFFTPDRYVGFDSEKTMLDVARREYPSYRFVSALENERADVVVCNSVVQYQDGEHWTAVVADVVRRADRAALIETYDGDYEETAGGCGAPIWIRHSSFYRAALGAAGAVDVERIELAPETDTAAHVLYIARTR